MHANETQKFNNDHRRDFTRENFVLTEQFSWACHIPEFADIMGVILLDGVELIDCAIKSEDIQRLYSGEELLMEEYFILSKMILDPNIDRVELLKNIKLRIYLDIDKVREAQKLKIDEKLEEVEQALSLYSDTDVKIHDGGSTPLGIVLSEEDRFSYAKIEESTFDYGDESELYKQIMISTMFIKDSEILIKYYYRDYHSQDDVSQAENYVNKWIDKNLGN